MFIGMYLRTTRRKNKDGSVVEYYQLAHNYRHPQTNRCVAEVIHNFGRADQLNRDDLVRLCRSIARVCGLEVRDPLQGEGASLSNREACLPDAIQLIGTVELGSAVVAEALWERLGIGPALRKAGSQNGCKVPYERALFAMTANRLCEPESKLGVWDRWLSKVYLPSCTELKLAQMYEAMDLLHDHVEAVENAVFFQTANLFNLVVDLIFYDTTTAAFSIDEEDDLRCFGRPKQGGFAPQVIVALAVTRQGLPVRSWVFPGNTPDTETVKRIRADLRGWKLGRALFVADSGLNSAENREELAKACGTYLLATRMGSVAEIKDGVLTRGGRYKVIADNLHAKEVMVGQGELRRRYILCYNPKEAKRQQEHRAEVVKELEQKLNRHPGRSATAKWAIELLASGRYKRYLTITAKGEIALNSKAVKDAARYDGKWVLITNDDTLSLEDAAQGYKGLLVIERCFRALKRTRIKMEPMYHWLPRRIEAHVKICVFALLIERVVELECGKPWPRIRETLRTLQASEFKTPTHRFFQRNELSRELQHILKSVKIQAPKAVLGAEPLAANK
jgi:hypothetical protein